MDKMMQFLEVTWLLQVCKLTYTHTHTLSHLHIQTTTTHTHKDKHKHNYSYAQTHIQTSTHTHTFKNLIFIDFYFYGSPGAALHLDALTDWRVKKPILHFKIY